MKNLIMAGALFTAAIAHSQVEIDKPVQLTGGTGERRVTGLELPVDGTDAASKEYVDSQLGSGGPRTIGELHGGGIVFAVFKNAAGEEHGFAVSTVDNGNTVPYSNMSGSAIGATARSSWDGASNSAAILGQSGHTSSAALVCDQYAGGGHTDWFLPSTTQYMAMWSNLYPIHKTLADVPGGQVFGQYYWTSTEVSADYALAMNFQSGSVYQESKGAAIPIIRVRCIREF
jgi:hypothetical protein